VIVVDTNVIVSLFVSSAFTPLAEAAAQKDNNWIVPALWVSEMRNALATMHRTRRLDIDEGLKAMERAERELLGRSVRIPSQPVLRFAAESGCSAYDCEFVALAVLAQTRLITLDKRLALRFPRVATPLDRFVGA
jgi:predicted nucleic acid-binding protein